METSTFRRCWNTGLTNITRLRKIESGGQTGADQAGLRAARAERLETGGWAPKGWETEEGPAPWLADSGLIELPCPQLSGKDRPGNLESLRGLHSVESSAQGPRALLCSSPSLVRRESLIVGVGGLGRSDVSRCTVSPCSNVLRTNARSLHLTSGLAEAVHQQMVCECRVGCKSALYR